MNPHFTFSFVPNKTTLGTRSRHQVYSNFLISKNKIVPKRSSHGSDENLSIAKKELIACLMGARLGQRVSSALNINSVTFWTDSQIALWWIKRPQKKVPIFVSNRVSQILALSDASSWNYIASSDNPADIPTRKFPLSKLPSSTLWKHGPQWLISNPKHWPSVPLFEQNIDVQTYLTTAVKELEEPRVSIFKLENYSSIEKVITSVAWWIRYVRILRCKIKGEDYNRQQHLTPLERESALHVLIRSEQESGFPTEFEALSTGNQVPSTSSLLSLKPSWDSQRSFIVSIGRERPLQPLILLPKKSYLARLILLSYHIKTFHGGSETTLSRSREKFWIVHGRVVAKQIIRSCSVCKVFSVKPYEQIESALPPSRVSESTPFSVTGCDYMGPLHTKDGQKCYILLFTCAVVRAVHIEVFSG